MSDWERIVNHFEANAKPCIHGNKPRVVYDPGCLFVETGKCNCRIIDGDGLPLSQVLSQWPLGKTSPLTKWN